MYANVKAGQPQLPVSRRMTISVEAHCAHKAKNTMTDNATGSPPVALLGDARRAPDTGRGLFSCPY